MIKKLTQHFMPRTYVIRFFLGLTAFFGLYLIIAWFGYSPLDNSWSVSNSQVETINKAGWLGAWIIDLCLVLFGHIGNIMPFLIFIVPIYLLRSKYDQQFTYSKFAFHFLGFTLLICGLSILAMLLLPTPTDYLAGGVLGGSLSVALFPLLGQFWLLLIALIGVILGFILSSGALLIHSLVKFYYWLTMKNETSESALDSNVDATSEEGSLNEPLEEIIIQQRPIAPTTNENLEENVTEQGESAVESPTVTQEMETEVKQTIQIHGLQTWSQESDTTQPQFTSSNEGFSPTQFTGFGVEDDMDLPQITIQNYTTSTAAPVAGSQDILQENHTGEKSAVDFQMETEGEILRVSIPDNAMTQVSETNHTARIAHTENSDQQEDDPETSAHMAELARQFAEQERQRLAEMEQRAKDMQEELTFQHIVESETQLDEEDDKQTPLTTPNYKGYGESLIHPAFQQKSTPMEKPTTPLPSLDLLEHRPTQVQEITREEILETSQLIEQKLRDFNVKATVQDVLVGPVVTRYELELQPGVKASKVTSIDNDLARALMFRSIRVAEVIPGKPYIGIETPNINRQTVPLRDVLDSEEFRQSKSLLSMALGKDISGKPVVVDLAKMPHLLVAGSTGSGKSVGVNTMILSLLFRVKPEDVKFIMIDPKVVELSIYNGIPHLLTEVVTDMKKAANALRWCVDEMERRYQLLSALRVRNIEGFNDKIDEYNAMGMPIPNPVWRPGDTMDSLPPALEKLSYIVVIVDEFADLMMVAGKQIEELIARLAQKARAIGIHLILATQRPSVDVITGLIKANIPSRIAFTVASKIDSRTILDQTGAEALLGRGDMLYSGQGSSDLVRVHGAFMSDDEVARIADDWRARGKPNYIEGILDSTEDEDEDLARHLNGSDELDDLFGEVMEFVLNTGTTSVSAIQRKFKVGFNRAARIMDQMEEQGVVSELQNGKREILARRSEY